MKLARNLIRNLESQGPAGLIHLPVITRIIHRPIRVWSCTGRLHCTIRADKPGTPVDIEYHASDSCETGHWTLLHNVDAVHSKSLRNDCLFSVICYQTGWEPRELRQLTIRGLKANAKQFEKYLNKIFKLENRGTAALMLGGARYIGRNAQDAARILDDSQNKFCDGCTQPGHPRGHASYPNATGLHDSVERYSKTGLKSGFVSRKQQNQAAHYALTHENAHIAMNNLNNGAFSSTAKVPMREVRRNGSSVMKMREYYNGLPVTNETDIRLLTLVLRHHKGKADDRLANVFVHTFYPSR